MRVSEDKGRPQGRTGSREIPRCRAMETGISQEMENSSVREGLERLEELIRARTTGGKGENKKEKEGAFWKAFQAWKQGHLVVTDREQAMSRERELEQERTELIEKVRGLEDEVRRLKADNGESDRRARRVLEIKEKLAECEDEDEWRELFKEEWPEEVYERTSWFREGDDVRDHDVVVVVDEAWKILGGGGRVVEGWEELAGQDMVKYMAAGRKITTETVSGYGIDTDTVRTRFRMYLMAQGDEGLQFPSLCSGFVHLR